MTLPTPSQRQTILVVDDRPDVRRLFQRLLRRLGYEVLLAEDGRVALEVFDASPIDLVLTDLVMPRMDGRTLALTLQDDLPQLKVLITSGYTSQWPADRAIDPFPFLAKPFSPAELATRVRAVLDDG